MSRILKKLNREEQPLISPGPDLKLVPDVVEISRPVSAPQAVVSKTRRVLFSFLLFCGVAAGSRYLILHSSLVQKASAPLVASTIDPQPTADVPKVENSEEKTHQEAISFFREKEYAKALEKFDLLYKKHPTDAALANNVGLTYMKLHDLKNAEARFQEALKIEPKDGITYNNLGSLKLMQQNSEESIFAFYQAILYSPEMIEPHLNLGKAFELAGRPMEAIPEYQYYLAHSLTSGDPAIRALLEKRIVKLNSFAHYGDHEN